MGSADVTNLVNALYGLLAAVIVVCTPFIANRLNKWLGAKENSVLADEVRKAVDTASDSAVTQILKAGTEHHEITTTNPAVVAAATYVETGLDGTIKKLNLPPGHIASMVEKAVLAKIPPGPKSVMQLVPGETNTALQPASPAAAVAPGQ